MFALVSLSLLPWVSSVGSSGLVQRSRMERELDARKEILQEEDGSVKTEEKGA